MGRTSKDKRDIYYRLAKEQGWRARSAFKLLHVDEKFQVFKNVNRAVDLCAAPGSWSQVLSKRLYETRSEDRESVKIIAVDLQGMAPIEGVRQMRADITKESTAESIIEFIGGQKAQLVVSDGAPDVTGMHDFDIYCQHQLVLAALSIATYVLEEGGSFVAKVYRSGDPSNVYAQLLRFFKDVCIFKPGASRNSSLEAFVVCRQFSPPPAYVPCNLIMAWTCDDIDDAIEDITGAEEKPRVCLPFIGYKSELDADRTYELDENYVYTEAVQQPLTAAYQDVLKKTREVSLKYNTLLVRHDGLKE